MPGRETYRLVMRRGPQPNQVFEINKDVMTVGRDITNDIVVNDREASRHHLRLVKNNDEIRIEDLGSTNGTFINGKRLSGSTVLKNGDMVGLGETVTFGFEVAMAAAEASPVREYNTYQPPQPQSQQSYQPASAQQSQPSYQPQSTYSPPTQYESQQPAYDPYYVEEGGGTMRWVVLGCLVFGLLSCICIITASWVVVDTLDIYCDVPLFDTLANILAPGKCF